MYKISPRLWINTALRKLKLTCKSRLEHLVLISLDPSHHPSTCPTNIIKCFVTIIILITWPRTICIFHCSIFRRHNRLVPRRLAAQRCRASLLSGGGGIFVCAIPTENWRRAANPIERDARPYTGAAHPGLQPSETAGEEDTDFHELRPRRIEFEQILNYREVFQWASRLESLYQPNRHEIWEGKIREVYLYSLSESIFIRRNVNTYACASAHACVYSANGILCFSKFSNEY